MSQPEKKKKGRSAESINKKKEGNRGLSSASAFDEGNSWDGEDLIDECEKISPTPYFYDEAEDNNDRHDMDVLRTIHDTNFREFPSWLSLAKKKKSNNESTPPLIESTHFAPIPNKNGEIRIVKKVSQSGFLNTELGD